MSLETFVLSYLVITTYEISKTCRRIEDLFGLHILVEKRLIDTFLRCGNIKNYKLFD